MLLIIKKELRLPLTNDPVISSGLHTVGSGSSPWIQVPRGLVSTAM